MLQAAFLDGQLLNLFSQLQDCRAKTVVHVSQSQVAKALGCSGGSCSGQQRLRSSVLGRPEGSSFPAEPGN